MQRHVNICVVMLDGKKLRRRVSAPPQKFFTSSDIDRVLDFEAEQLDRLLPGRAFRLVPLQGSHFNLVEVPVPRTEAASA